MSTITADATLQTILGTLKDVTEIRDANGNVLGTYTPKHKVDEDILKSFDLKKAKETLAKEYNQGRPLKEILERLEATEKKR